MNNKILKYSCLSMALLLAGCASSQPQLNELQMRVQDGYIQYYSGTEWKDLISTDELRGEKGEPGKDGKDGRDGVDGTNGINGKNGRDGKNGINGVDGIDGTNGTNGKNGIDGRDGVSTVLSGITKDFTVGIHDTYGFYNMANIEKIGNFTVDCFQNAIFTQQSFDDGSTANLKSASFSMNENGTVTLTAVPEDGWRFDSWSDGVTSATRTIKYSDDVTLFASFLRTQYNFQWPSPDSGSVAEVTHHYSDAEPWTTVEYYSSSLNPCLTPCEYGSTVEAEESFDGSYFVSQYGDDIKIRYENATIASSLPSDNANVCLSLIPSKISDAFSNHTLLRLKATRNDEPINLESLLPSVDSVSWLYEVGQAPKPVEPTPEPIAVPEPEVVPELAAFSDPTAEPTHINATPGPTTPAPLSTPAPSPSD